MQIEQHSSKLLNFLSQHWFPYSTHIGAPTVLTLCSKQISSAPWEFLFNFNKLVHLLILFGRFHLFFFTKNVLLSWNKCYPLKLNYLINIHVNNLERDRAERHGSFFSSSLFFLGGKIKVKRITKVVVKSHAFQFGLVYIYQIT